MISWTAAGSSDPLVTGVRYALYSQCGAETTFQLIADDIQGLSYNITTLPTLTQCVLRVVVYSDHCLLDVNGPNGDTTGNFTTGKVWNRPQMCADCSLQVRTYVQKIKVKVGASICFVIMELFMNAV